MVPLYSSHSSPPTKARNPKRRGFRSSWERSRSSWALSSLSKSFDLSSLANGTASLANGTASIFPPPPVLLDRTGVVGENGKMTDDFEVGDYDPKVT